MRHCVEMVVASSLLSCSLNASAHHSYSQWSPQQATLAGTIKDFQWTNPHIWIQLLVEDSNHHSSEWSFESASPGVLHRVGWKVSTLKPGDKVTLTYHPKRDGSQLGSLIRVVLPDQSVLEVRDLVTNPPPQEPGGLTGENPAAKDAPPAGPPPTEPQR